MRNIHNEMDNDPSSTRNYDRDPMDDLNDSVDEMEEYAAQFFAEDTLDENSEFHTQGEFMALNNQLDQLQSALDVLESRNADIHQELLQLLQSNREVRRVMEEEMQSENDVNPTDSDIPSIPNNSSNIIHSDDAVTSSTQQQQPLGDVVVPDPSDDSTPIAAVTLASEINLVQSIDAIKLEKVTN